ncbi:MAG: lipopolysaccharide biosynthesis protein [Leptolyngbyaceae bacterium]|nr:lipopolysaccharide biosynthesis protein [Leptolyngbyaceae bacterium]
MLKDLANSRLFHNISWLGISEVFVRVSRLITTVILSHFLSPHEYGLTAIILTLQELTKVFSDIGINAKIIQAKQEQLADLCNSAFWLHWVVYSSLFVIQCLMAFVVANFYHESQLILPICAMATIYLITPIGLIQEGLIRRENDLKIIATNSAIVTSIANILTAGLAFLGWGIWSIVAPAVLVTPLWAYLFFQRHAWRPTQAFTTYYWKDIFMFGRSILGIQFLKTLRNNLDYLMIGHFIGIKALGIYFFAFNAGLGISLSIINALYIALLPHFCAARSQWSDFKKSYFNSLKLIAVVICSVVLLQSVLAPVYVPIVFGQKWIPAIPILILICLSAIPRPFADSASQLLVAIDKPHLAFYCDVVFTLFFVVALMIGLQWNVIGVATAVLIVHAVVLPIYTVLTTYHVFYSGKEFPLEAK